MAWTGTTTTSAALTLTSSFATIQASGGGDLVITLAGPYAVALIEIEADFQSSPTDDAEWQILGSVDGTGYDTEPVAAGRLDNGTDPARVSVPVAGFKNLIVQMRQTGSTDTTNSGTVTYDTGS